MRAMMHPTRVRSGHETAAVHAASVRRPSVRTRSAVDDAGVGPAPFRYAPSLSEGPARSGGRAAPSPDGDRAAVLLLLALMPADLFAAFPSCPATPRPRRRGLRRSPRPDIVVFVLDDIPPLDGRLWDPLPNIRKTFVDRGVRFSDAHGETPTCCPGRAGFLTGLHTHHHGTYKTDGSLFRPGETIATSLQDSGYYTIQVGKYLNLFEAVYPKLPPGWSDFRGYGGGYYDYRIWANGVPRSFGRRRKDFSTDVIARMSLDAIKGAPRSRPIFAWLTPFAVHAPYTRPPG